jgi:hypothetical protein
LTKQDERLRLRNRLLDRAIEHAFNNRWQDAISDNLRLLELSRDTETINRLGKAYMEVGDYDKALRYYRETLNLNQSNSVAKKNIAQLEYLKNSGSSTERQRRYGDLQLFVVDGGKTALTRLVDPAGPEALAQLTIGEEVQIEHDEQRVWITDNEGRTIGYLEPQLARRMQDMLGAGNRYVAVVAELDVDHVKVLLRETYLDASQRDRVSFPGKLGGDIATFRTFREPTSRFDFESEDLLEEEIVEEDAADDTEEDFLRTDITEEDNEVGLDVLENDLNDDDEEEG